jgi:hypothetical protein
LFNPGNLFFLALTEGKSDGKVIGKESLGKSHWEKVIGKKSLGKSYWKNVIGKMCDH